MPLYQQLGGFEGVTGLYQLNPRIAFAQELYQRAALGDRQALAFHRVQAGRRPVFLARQHHVGVFEIGPAEVQLGLPLGAWNDGTDHVGLAGVDLVDRCVHIALALEFEAQPGAQADQLQQVGGDAAKIAVGIEEGQRCEGFVDNHLDHRVIVQPALLAFGQLQLLVGQQDVAAGTPALGNALAFIGGHPCQH